MKININKNLNYMKLLVLVKFKRKFKVLYLKLIKRLFFYNLLYLSTWHLILFKNKKIRYEQQYMTAVPNQGAGVGHQLANWNAGVWFAKYFCLSFAHTPLSPKWENCLGLGEIWDSVKILTHNHGYKKVKLPYFNEDSVKSVNLIKEIISSYAGNKIIFVLEQDQFYKDQIGVIEEFRKSFYGSSKRKNDSISYSKKDFNIAIHIRRGDITRNSNNYSEKENLKMRWQDSNYFIKLIAWSLDYFKNKDKVMLHLFSQGINDEFKEFEKFNNIKFHININETETFINMVYADVLITSKSSFSYKPALLSLGLKICPKNFWHSYPKTKEWILADDNGNVI